MNISKLLIPTILLTSLALGPNASAQEGLLEIYELALVNDPALREAEANYLVAAEARPQARSNLLPSLSLGTTRSRQESENPSPPTNFVTGDPVVDIASTESQRDGHSLSLSLNQTIFNRPNFIAMRQADKTVARAEIEFAAAQQDLLVRVATAYFNVLAAEDTLASEIAARESIARQLEQTQRRFDVGLIAITDVQEAQAGYDQSVATEIAAERALATSHEFLREIIGEYVTELRAPGEALPLLNPEPANVEQWVDMAQDQNLLLLSSRLNTDIAQDDIDIQRAARLPTINFSSSVSDSTNRNEQTSFFVAGNSLTTNSANLSEGFSWQFNFSMPITTGGLNRSRVQQSVFRHRAAMETLERVLRQTERETRDAYLGVISEISRVQALRQAVQSSETALRATEAGFDVGTRTTVDVLNSQNNLRRAQTTYSRSRYDYILNVLRLKQAAGSLDEEDVVEVDGWLN